MLKLANGKAQIDGKITPEAFQCIMLDEIASKLSVLINKIENQSAKGNLFTNVYSVNTVGIKFVVLYRATLYNDGANNVYVLTADRNITGDDAPLKTNDSLQIPLGARNNIEYWLKTLTGTASVRIFQLE